MAHSFLSQRFLFQQWFLWSKAADIADPECMRPNFNLHHFPKKQYPHERFDDLSWWEEFGSTWKSPVLFWGILQHDDP